MYGILFINWSQLIKRPILICDLKQFGWSKTLEFGFRLWMQSFLLVQSSKKFKQLSGEFWRSQSFLLVLVGNSDFKIHISKFIGLRFFMRDIDFWCLFEGGNSKWIVWIANDLPAWHLSRSDRLCPDGIIDCAWVTLWALHSNSADCEDAPDLKFQSSPN